MNKNILPTFLAASILGLAMATTIGAWPNDPAESVVICDAEWTQNGPAIVADGIGGVVIAWSDGREELEYDLYVQKLDTWGNAHWEENGRLICGLAGAQSRPRLAGDGQFGAILSWADGRAGNWDIYLQRLSQDGAELWGPNGFPVTTNTSGQVNHEMIGDGAGGVVVAWIDGRNGMADNLDVFAQRFDGDGNPLWPGEAVAVCTENQHQSIVYLCGDGSGGAILAWLDERNSDYDIYAQWVDATGAPQWTPGGVVVCDEPGFQSPTAMVSDGAGGAYVVWRDERDGNTDVYAQRLDSYGDPYWADNGVGIQATSHGEYFSSAIGDGDGGLIVGWTDGRNATTGADIYAQRVDRWGNALWTPGGEVICSVNETQRYPRMTSDGAGGAVVVWEDYRATGYDSDLYAQRVDENGYILWPQDGVAVADQLELDEEYVLATDGVGGTILAWTHGDVESWEGDIFAQRIERNGYLGFPAPFIIEVVDHPADQGGEVILTWVPSYLDTHPHTVVTHYTVWRRFPAPPDGAALASSPLVSPDKTGWSYVGEVAASYMPEYGYEAPTYADSTEAGNPLTDFLVVAQTYDQWMFWPSPPAAGYSVDNLAPGAPLALMAQSIDEDIALQWSASGENDEDLAVYDLHRSDLPGFEPDATTLLTATSDTTHVDIDPGTATWYYLVIAVDVHGNESAPSNEASATIVTAVEGGVPSAFALHGNRPNPFNPVTYIRYDVPPGGGHVYLAVYDLTGRLVRVLVEDNRAAGARTARWDGTDAEGRAVASGVYYCRMEAAGCAQIVKMALVR